MLNNNLDSIDNYQHLIHNQSVRQLLNNPLLLKDCWSLSQDLCLSAPAHRKFSSLDFTNYSQDWLKIVVKIYILLRVGSGTSASTIQKDVYNLQKFDSFLKTQYVYSFEQINSGIFENFDYYLRSKNIKEITIHRYYATLVVFFDTCRLEGWFDVSTYWFKGRRKSFYPNHEEINYIPEEVWNQLESNLHYLPEQIQRMVLVIRTTGIRIGELLNMPYDCLRKRDNQWRLRFLTEKYEIEDELPITAELAVVIKEQQEYIVELFGNSYECLFCNSNASGWKTLKKNIERLKKRIHELEADLSEFRRKNEALAGQVYRVHSLQEQVERQKEIIETLENRLKSASQQATESKVIPLNKKSAVVSERILGELNEIGIELNNNLIKLIQAATESDILAAIEYYKYEQERTNIENPGGWLARAIKGLWKKPNVSQTSNPEKLSKEPEVFSSNATLCNKKFVSLEELVNISNIFDGKSDD